MASKLGQVGLLSLTCNRVILLILSLLILASPVVAQNPLSVSVTTDKPQYSPGENVVISGKVLDNQNNAVMGATVSIQVNDPQNNPVEVRLVYSDQSGAYSDPFVLSTNAVQGQYTVFASATKSGLSSAQAETRFSVSTQTTSTLSPSSSTQSTSPPPSKCFIATAIYGSELSPEVSLLRNFRDAEVLNTLAGRSFMGAFNAVYYSFSPQVASFVASDNSIRTTMKIVLYPLVGILYISSELFWTFSFNPELAVTLSGLFAALGIGVVYFGPITAIVCRVSKPRRTSWHFATARIALASGSLWIGVLGLAEMIHLNTLLTAATVGVVLSFIVLGGFTVSGLLTRLAGNRLSGKADVVQF